MHAADEYLDAIECATSAAYHTTLPANGSNERFVSELRKRGLELTFDVDMKRNPEIIMAPTPNEHDELGTYPYPSYIVPA